MNIFQLLCCVLILFHQFNIFFSYCLTGTCPEEPCTEPTIENSDPAWSGHFPASNALIETCESTQKSIFLLPDGHVDKSFTVDIGCPETISVIYLKNTKDGPYRDR
jgi:hypothetical protein